MTVKPKSFLELANAVRTSLSDSFGEASHRCVVNRAYYAAFLTALYKLGKTSFPDDATVHVEVSKAVGQVRGDESKQILDGLREMRRIADYDLGATVGDVRAEEAIQDATEFIALFS